MTPYTLIDTPQGFARIEKSWQDLGVSRVALDFEEESNFHVYGEHLCLAQIFDGRAFYIVDVLATGSETLRAFLEGPVEKVMFDCSADSALIRRSCSIRLRNVCDLRVMARLLGFENGLNALIERNLGITVETRADKRRSQMSNWMVRPLRPAQIEYALNDVRYLLCLRQSLMKELSKAPELVRRSLSLMKRCAEPVHPDRPGWERLPGFRKMDRQTRNLLIRLYNARDEIARGRNSPPSYVISKQSLVAMAGQGKPVGVSGLSEAEKKIIEAAFAPPVSSKSG